MSDIDTDFARKVEKMENIIFVCFGKPKGEELPQVMAERDVIADLIQEQSGQPYEKINNRFHHTE